MSREDRLLVFVLAAAVWLWWRARLLPAIAAAPAIATVATSSQWWDPVEERWREF